MNRLLAIVKLGSAMYKELTTVVMVLFLTCSVQAQASGDPWQLLTSVENVNVYAQFSECNPEDNVWILRFENQSEELVELDFKMVLSQSATIPALRYSLTLEPNARVSGNCEAESPSKLVYPVSDLNNRDNAQSELNLTVQIN